MRWLALLVFAAGCIEAGIAIGWWLRDRQTDDLAPLTIEAVVDRPVILPATETGVAGLMPSVVGLGLDQARQILFDAGVAGNAILVFDRPTALESGLVVSQEPAPGSEVSETVVIIVAASASMPNLVGFEVSDAQRVLAELDSTATVQRIFSDGSQPGVVMKTEPAAGANLPSVVVLHVSAT